MGEDDLKVTRFPSDSDPLREVDDRGWISLAKVAKHRRYLVTEQPNGQILLTPVEVVPAGNRADAIPESAAGGDSPASPHPGWTSEPPHVIYTREGSTAC